LSPDNDTSTQVLISNTYGGNLLPYGNTTNLMVTSTFSSPHVLITRQILPWSWQHHMTKLGFDCQILLSSGCNFVILQDHIMSLRSRKLLLCLLAICHSEVAPLRQDLFLHITFTHQTTLALVRCCILLDDLVKFLCFIFYCLTWNWHYFLFMYTNWTISCSSYLKWSCSGQVEYLLGVQFMLINFSFFASKTLNFLASLQLFQFKVGNKTLPVPSEQSLHSVALYSMRSTILTAQWTKHYMLCFHSWQHRFSLALHNPVGDFT
jgi:hypothetical protein